MREDLRFLIVAFDGLRPDMVHALTMPNLWRLRGEAAHFPASRAVFPSETRVNQATLITGCQPRRHGIVANKFIDVDLFPDGLFNSADYDALARADASPQARLIHAPTLGEVLHAGGGDLAVLGCGTPGGNRLLHHRAPTQAALNMSLHGLDQSATPQAAQAVVDDVGAMPAAEIPNRDRISWLVNAYIGHVVPERDPTVTILWFSDPDVPYHYRGIGSDEAIESLRHADAELGHLLAWREASGRADSLQIVVLSDHGHVTTVGEPVDILRQLGEAGFNAGAAPAAALDVVVAPGTCASFYVADAGARESLVAWLRTQSWCGSMFCRGGDGRNGLLSGTFDLALAQLDHPRSADIVVVLTRDDAPDHAGLSGRCRHDNPEIPNGGGLHGGLNAKELHNLLLFSGSAFRRGVRFDAAAGLVDVMPTLLDALGLGQSLRMDGRVLSEALREGPAAPPTTEYREHVVGAGAYRQTLRRARTADTHYLDYGGRSDAGALVATARR